MTDAMQTMETPSAPAADTPEAPAAPVSREDVRASILEGSFPVETVSDAPSDAVPVAPAEGAQDAQGADGEAPAAEAAPVTDPDAVPSIETPVGPMRIRNADGTYASHSTQTVEFAVGGKTYAKPIADLVRMAHDGVAGQRAVAEMHQVRQQAEQAEQQLTAQLSATQQAHAELAEVARALLSGDEGVRQQMLQQWESLHAPEAVADRRLAEAQRLEQRAAQQIEQFQRTQFAATHVVPALTALFQDAPDVPEAQILGQVQMDWGAVLSQHGGQVPAQMLPHFAQYVAGPLAEAVRAEQSRRAGSGRVAPSPNSATSPTASPGPASTGRPSAAPDPRLVQAQLQAQRAQRDVAVAFQPVGSASPDAPRPRAAPRTRAEAREQILRGFSE